MNYTVSIIIPVFNSESYLKRCLGNIVHQTLKNIEIIIVNDASTDNSLSIIKHCQKIFINTVSIKIVNLEVNLGAGGARNKGIQVAKGEYIGFVDSDDLVDITMFEKLYTKAKAFDYDVVDCGYFCDSTNSAIIHTSDELTGVLQNHQRSELIASGGYIWSKIYKREIFNQQIFKYGNSVFRGKCILEDADFLTYIFATIKSLGNVKEILYRYSNTANSLSKVSTYNNYLDNSIAAIYAIYHKVHSLPNYHSIKESVEYQILQLYSYCVNLTLFNKKHCKNEETLANNLLLLKNIKKELITGDYTNKFVKNKIQKQDIDIMIMNDSYPDNLINTNK